MYGIFTYIWLICMVDAGKYTIHGCYGNNKKMQQSPTPTQKTKEIILELWASEKSMHKFRFTFFPGFSVAHFGASTRYLLGKEGRKNSCV